MIGVEWSQVGRPWLTGGRDLDRGVAEDLVSGDEFGPRLDYMGLDLL